MAAQKKRLMVPVQVNFTCTICNSANLPDSALQQALSLGKNETAGLDLEAIVRTALAAGAFKRKSVRRSKQNNLCVIAPVRVEGEVIKVDVTEAKTSSRKTDEEKKAELLRALGL